MPDQHRRGDDRTCVVEPEEPVEQPATKQSEHLLQKRHDRQNDEAQGQQVRVHKDPAGRTALLGSR